MALSICTALIFLSNKDKFPFHFQLSILTFREKATNLPASLFFLCCISYLYDLIQILQEVTLGFQELCRGKMQQCLNYPFCQQISLLRLPPKTFKVSQPFSPTCLMVLVSESTLDHPKYTQA